MPVSYNRCIRIYFVNNFSLQNKINRALRRSIIATCGRGNDATSRQARRHAAVLRKHI